MTRHVVLTFAVRAARLALGVIASVVTARALGPTGRGDYYFVVTFAGLLVQFGNVGLASSNTYLVASDRTRLAGLVANSVWVALAAGVGGALVAALLLGSGAVPGIPGALIWFGVALGPPTSFLSSRPCSMIAILRATSFRVFPYITFRRPRSSETDPHQSPSAR